VRTMGGGAFVSRRETLTAALQAVMQAAGLDRSAASRQIVQAIQQKQLKIYFVGLSTMRRSEWETIDWNSIDVERSTIRYKPRDAMSWEVLPGGAGIPAPIEIEISDRERLWVGGKHKRYATDDDLVREGVDGIRLKRWPNPYQAAQALAPRAEGTSEAAKVKRLRTKIAAAGV
jgi:hypothetical protein